MLSRLVKSAGFVSLLVASACMDDGKGPEDDLDITEEGGGGGKADTMRKPTEHGVAPFGAGMPSEITNDAQFHAWVFELSADAKIDATTSYAVLGQRRTDTVMYLYKQKADGTWGPYIARNDDYGTTVYSQVKRDLGAGTYRVLVKGYAAETRGKFKLTVNCEGEGCVTVDPDACLFGDAYWEMRENTSIQIVNEQKIRPDTLNTLSPANQALLQRAVEEASYENITSPADALSRVDEDEVNVRWIVEPAARRSFISFEYGAGDNSYGAIFANPSGTKVTGIHDGDLGDCTVRRETCQFPADWNALKSTSTFARLSSRIITNASQLTAAQQAQALDAFAKVYGAPVATVDAGIERADDRRINAMRLQHGATGTVIDAYEFGAGDTSVGALYFGGTTERAGVISDLFIDECAFFAE